MRVAAAHLLFVLAGGVGHSGVVLAESYGAVVANDVVGHGAVVEGATALYHSGQRPARWVRVHCVRRVHLVRRGLARHAHQIRHQSRPRRLLASA